MMSSKQELTPREFEKLAFQEKHRRLHTDSPDTDFAESVRKYLIKNNLFKPLPDQEMAATPQGRHTPLTLTDTPSPTSDAPTSSLAS
ncbi:MAG: hypothetical protein P1U36_01950 [Legionellaceae bacterium]|nr:hypothetical protein [Legionellaceae bacterium]